MELCFHNKYSNIKKPNQKQQYKLEPDFQFYLPTIIYSPKTGCITTLLFLKIKFQKQIQTV